MPASSATWYKPQQFTALCYVCNTLHASLDSKCLEVVLLSEQKLVSLGCLNLHDVEAPNRML